MESVRKDLRQVWEILQSARIKGALAIIEYIAWLLTEGKLWTIDPKARPQQPRYSYNPDNSQLLALLTDAAEQIDKANIEQSIAQLFNKHIMFYASPSRQRDSYPTPRHIVDFMLDLIDVRPEHDFADFACGSGGFLIPLLPPLLPTTRIKNRLAQRPTQQTPTTYGKRIGVDISPNWVHIANANIMLHTSNDTHAQIKEGDAQRLYGPGGLLVNENFDRIAMSPPLGLAIGKDEQLSDELFTNLLLDQLKHDGRGAILVSNHLVEDGAYNLREYLSEQVTAVITLAEGMPPPIREPAHILLVNRGQSLSNKATWFLNIERDGYPSERKRDLSEEPTTAPEENDLLFARSVVKCTGREQSFERDTPVAHKKIMNQEKLLGVIIKLPKDYYVHIHRVESDEHISLAIDYASEDNPSHIMTKEILLKSSDSSQQAPNNLMTNNPMTKHIVEHDKFYGHLIAITNEGRVLGTREPLSQLRLTQYNLLPSTYLDQLKPKVYPRSLTGEFEEAIILDVIPQLGIESEPLTIHHEPSPSTSLSLHPPLEITPHLLAALNPHQRAVWEVIQALDSKRPYFTAEQLPSWLGHSNISSTLNLLTRLGLLVPITLNNGKARHALQCYRRTVQSELVTPELPSKTVK